jgi:hypothetical protein
MCICTMYVVSSTYLVLYRVWHTYTVRPHVHYGVIVQMQRGVRVGAAFVLCTGSTIRHIRTESNLYAD